MECGQDAYVDLMKRYPLVTDAFLQLKPGYQKVCHRLSVKARPAQSLGLLSCFPASGQYSRP